MRKYFSIKNNSHGFSHVLVPVLIVVAIAVVGTYMLVASHADSAPTAVAASASNVYAIRSNYQKTSGGRGVWMANDANGYYIGRAFAGDKVQIAKTVMSCQDNDQSRCEQWGFGLIKSDTYGGHPRTAPVYTYAWLKTLNLKRARGVGKITDNSYILNKENEVRSRNAIGGTFNCQAHECIDGKPVTLVAGCYKGVF